MLNVIGIDYSMVCPAITIHTGNDWSSLSCNFHYLLSKKKKDKPIVFTSNSFNISDNKHNNSSFYCKTNKNEERFEIISSWAISIIKPINEPKVYLEDYSFSSRGRQTAIGENCGLLKNKLFLNNINHEVFSPGTIKKFATGNGSSTKDKMFDAFFEETLFPLDSFLCSHFEKSPCNDVVDSYFICKLGLFTLLKK